MSALTSTESVDDSSIREGIPELFRERRFVGRLDFMSGIIGWSSSIENGEGLGIRPWRRAFLSETRRICKNS